MNRGTAVQQRRLLLKKETENKRKEKVRKKAPTAEDYYEQGVSALTKMEPELAIGFLKRAFDLECENLLVLDAYSEACIQLGERAEALALLQKATIIDSTDNSRWLTMAQLQCGQDALSSFQHGVQLILLKLGSDGISEADVKRNIVCLSQAYTSMAELYMTDLCYEENAEDHCANYVALALERDPTSLDGNQALASLRLSQKRNQEASAIMQELCSRTMEMRTKFHQLTVIQELLAQPNGQEDELAQSVPTLEFSIQTAKLLVECAKECPALSTQAIDLLTDLLNDDDENIEVWYILGIAALGLNPPDHDFARYHFERAHEMLMALYEQIGSQEFPYVEELRLVQEHLGLLGLENPPPGDEMNIDGDLDEDEEWTDDDEMG